MNQDQTTITKPLKRTRVSRACNMCRQKKIKCDIDKQYPCSSCVQYCCDCTSNDSPKKRPPPKGYIESLERRLRQMEQLLQNKDPRSDLAQRKGDNSTNKSSLTTPDHHDTKVMRHIGFSSPYYLMGKQKQEEERLKQQPEGSTNKNPGHTGDNNSGNNNNKLVQHTLMVPGHGKKLELIYDDDNDDMMVIHDQAPKQHLLKEDREENGLEGILSGNIIEILSQKFIDLHPIILPAIGKRSILESARNSSSNPLLTSSICSYVALMLPIDDDTFENYGIDRRDLIRKLADKENELLRTAFLTPTISHIQALIILCCHPTHISIFTGIWLRTGIAIRMSQDLGLHRSLTNLSNSKEMRELGKTLWYCVYILDRWSCAVLGRPLAIVDSDCNVELPQHSIINDNDISHTGDSTLDDGDDEYQQKHTFFILIIKLSGILGEIQRRIYSPKAKANLGTSGTSTTQMVDSLQKLLLEWYDQVPAYARLTKDDIARMASPSTTKEEKTALLQTTQWRLGGSLMICYNAVTILLHRPFIIPDNETLFSPTSTKRCMESAMFATDVARLMDVQSFTHFYWNIIIYSLSVVISIHMFNCISDQLEVSRMARHYLRLTIDVWDHVGVEFPYTPRQGALSPLHYAIKLLGLKGISPEQPQPVSSPAPVSQHSIYDSDDTDDIDRDGTATTTKNLVYDQHSAASIEDTADNQIQSKNQEPYQPQQPQQQVSQSQPLLQLQLQPQQQQQQQQQEQQQQQQQQQQQPESASSHYPAVDPSASMTYLLQQNIPASAASASSSNDIFAAGGYMANNSTLPLDNQLLDNENWQQIFLNNMGPNPFDFSDNKNGDDFWQNNFSLF